MSCEIFKQPRTINRDDTGFWAALESQEAEKCPKGEFDGADGLKRPPRKHHQLKIFDCIEAFGRFVDENFVKTQNFRQ